MLPFSKQLDNAYKKKVLDKLEDTVIGVTLAVDSELVNTTPVDTGRARSNWLPSLNRPDGRQVGVGQKPDTRNAIARYKLSDTIFITNNLPYITKLNEGSSQQAPAGFVDAAILRGKQAVR
jgi:hypothetical protein